MRALILACGMVFCFAFAWAADESEVFDREMFDKWRLSQVSPEEMLAYSLPFADKGDPRAQFAVGVIHYEKKSYMEARVWLEKSAKQDYLPAITTMGLVLLEGETTEDDYSLAVMWLEKAVNYDNGVAAGQLAELHLLGRGVPQDMAKAASLFGLAAARGIPFFEEKAVDYLENESPEHSLIYCMPYAEAGVAEAQRMAGSILFLTSKVDMNESRTWLRKSAEQGDFGACLLLGCSYMEGPVVKRDYGQAVYWLEKALAAGFQRTELLTWLEDFAEEGNPVAQHYLGTIYAKGLGVPKDSLLGYKWLNLAALTPSYLFEDRLRAAEDRNRLEAEMTLAEIAEAKKLCREFQPAKP